MRSPAYSSIPTGAAPAPGSADAPEQQQVVADATPQSMAVGHERGVREVLLHRAQAHGERLLPDRVAAGVPPALALVQADDVAGEVDQRVGAAVAARDLHASAPPTCARHRHAASSRTTKA
jgi:hypothetical protein